MTRASFDTSALEKRLAKVLATAKAPIAKTLGLQGAKILAAEIDRQFNVEGDPKWKRLAPATVAKDAASPFLSNKRTRQNRRSAGGQYAGRKILTRTARLRRSVRVTEKDGSYKVSFADYGEYHQSGTSKMPSRPFVRFSKGTAAKIAKALAKKL